MRSRRAHCGLFFVALGPEATTKLLFVAFDLIALQMESIDTFIWSTHKVQVASVCNTVAGASSTMVTRAYFALAFGKLAFKLFHGWHDAAGPIASGATGARHSTLPQAVQHNLGISQRDARPVAVCLLYIS